jgi:hypothetical protein
VGRSGAIECAISEAKNFRQKKKSLTIEVGSCCQLFC